MQYCSRHPIKSVLLLHTTQLQTDSGSEGAVKKAERALACLCLAIVQIKSSTIQALHAHSKLEGVRDVSRQSVKTGPKGEGFQHLAVYCAAYLWCCT